MSTSRHPVDPPLSPEAISPARRAVLERVLDMIVPPLPARGLPGASQVGVLARLLGEGRGALPQTLRELDQLEARASAEQGCGLHEMPLPALQALVDAARAADPAFMQPLALEAVTCYYQDERVLAAIGVEPRPPYPQGYQVIGGDLELLAPVRRRGPIWRQV